MSNVVKLKGETAVQGAEAVAKVIAWLREQADMLEKGDARPAHKAVLTVFEDCSGQIRTHTAFCNASTIERVGIMYLAMHDTASTD